MNGRLAQHHLSQIILLATLVLGVLAGLLAPEPPVVAAQEEHQPPSIVPLNADATERKLFAEIGQREQQLGPLHPDVAVALNDLGVYYVDRARYADATAPYNRAIQIFETAGPARERQLAIVLSNLGYALNLDGRNDQAVPHLQRALELNERLYGPDHLQVAYSLNLISLAYNDLGMANEAEAVLIRALAIREILTPAPWPIIWVVAMVAYRVPATYHAYASPHLGSFSPHRVAGRPAETDRATRGAW